MIERDAEFGSPDDALATARIHLLTAATYAYRGDITAMHGSIDDARYCIKLFGERAALLTASGFGRGLESKP